MKNTAWIWVGIVVLVAVGGWLAWTMLANKSTPPATSTPNTSSNSSAESDQPIRGNADVTIKDMAFSPATLKVKKGTTVTWTNQDDVGHNAVGDDAKEGGLPTEAGLLSKGQTQSFSFNTVGTFSYHCTTHPFMKGTIEVVE